MKYMLICSLFCFPVLSGAQKLAVGGYITPTYGNIFYKGNPYNYLYCEPAFTVGGGLDLNYYKKRWVLNTGVNFKNAGGNLKIALLNDDGSWEGKYVKYLNSLPVITLPIGVHYAIIYHDNFKLYGGVRIENGLLVNQELIIDFHKYKSRVKMNQKYYFGIMPGVRMEFKVTERKFLFSNLGVCYQVNHFELHPSNQYKPTIYRINNLFIDIGFGYRLKN